MLTLEQPPSILTLDQMIADQKAVLRALYKLAAQTSQELTKLERRRNGLRRRLGSCVAGAFEPTDSLEQESTPQVDATYFRGSTPQITVMDDMAIRDAEHLAKVITENGDKE